MFKLRSTSKLVPSSRPGSSNQKMDYMNVILKAFLIVEKKHRIDGWSVNSED